MSLTLGESPRLTGEDKAHVLRLAQVDTPLPPILVHRGTMRVIDGFHRLMAASLRGHETIEVQYFQGTPEDAFLLGVEANVAHGLPLSQRDRHAAAVRILGTHPAMSDRAIARSTGLSPKTVAELRRESGAGRQPAARVGVDGRVRPLNGSEGRLRVAELFAQDPHRSLRKVAREAGVSPTTALDVRRRLARGEPPVPVLREAAHAGWPAERAQVREDGAEREDGESPVAALEKLMRDPSLLHSEHGRALLRLLRANVTSASTMSDVGSAVPSHWLVLTTQLAAQVAQMWSEFASDLGRRAKVADPLAERLGSPALERS
jgi:hypothetical protein